MSCRVDMGAIRSDRQRAPSLDRPPPKPVHQTQHPAVHSLLTTQYTNTNQHHPAKQTKHNSPFLPVARRLARAKLIFTYDPGWSGGLRRSPIMYVGVWFESVWFTSRGWMCADSRRFFGGHNQPTNGSTDRRQRPTREHAAAALQVRFPRG